MHENTSAVGTQRRHRIVILGGGFGGLSAVAGLKGVPVDIVLIDQRNHHLFQPLLYQAATASLATSEIAWPIRSIVRDRPEVTTLLGTVEGIDADRRLVHMGRAEPIAFDTLILATGARHGYFGHDEWETFAPGLKTVEDAILIRRRILKAFEDAELERDVDARAALLTFVVIGGGPTGVELAGTIADLARDTLKGEYRSIDPHMARILLIEAGDRVLAGFADALSAYTRSALEKLGVEVSLGTAVNNIEEGVVTMGAHHVQARTIVWAAGVRASPAAEWLGVPSDRSGRMFVEPDLSVPGNPCIFAVGDTIAIKGPDGRAVPGIAPAAKQTGRYVADVIRDRLAGHPPRPPFSYRHDGSLAQIGKAKAVIDFGRIKLHGVVAWWLWGIAHIFFLIGTRSRLSVALSWLWIYLRDQRSARLIIQPELTEPVPTKPPPVGRYVDR
jgi:NADH dehydrogenase